MLFDSKLFPQPSTHDGSTKPNCTSPPKRNVHILLYVPESAVVTRKMVVMPLNEIGNTVQFSVNGG
jgi:hypothetical protein